MGFEPGATGVEGWKTQTIPLSLCYAYFKQLDWLSIFFNQSDCIIFMYTIICLKGVCKGSIVKEGMKESSWIGMIYDTFGM